MHHTYEFSRNELLIAIALLIVVFVYVAFLLGKLENLLARAQTAETRLTLLRKDAEADNVLLSNHIDYLEGKLDNNRISHTNSIAGAYKQYVPGQTVPAIITEKVLIPQLPKYKNSYATPDKKQPGSYSSPM